MLFCFLVLMANCLSFIFHAQVGSEAKGHHLNLMTLSKKNKKNWSEQKIIFDESSLIRSETVDTEPLPEEKWVQSAMNDALCGTHKGKTVADLAYG